MSSHLNKDIFTETGCVSRDMLIKYRDGLLRRSEMHEVEKHLIDCSLCSEALEGLSLITGTAVLDEISEKLRGDSIPTGHTTPYRNLAVAASISAIALLTYVAIQQTENVTKQDVALAPEQPPATVVEPMPKVAKAEENNTTNEIPKSESIKFTSPTIVNGSTSLIEKTTDQTTADEFIAPSEDAAAMVPDDGVETMNQGAKAEMKDSEEATEILEAPAIQGTSAGYMKNVAYVDDLKVIDYSTISSAPTQKKRSETKAATSAEETEKTTTSSTLFKGKSSYLNRLKIPISLYKKGKYTEAIPGFDQLLMENPTDENAQFYKGMCLFELKKYDEALLLLTPVGNGLLQPFSQEAFFYTGRCFEEKGDKPRALEIYRKIISTRGDYKDKAAKRIKLMN